MAPILALVAAVLLAMIERVVPVGIVAGRYRAENIWSSLGRVLSQITAGLAA